MAYSYSGIKDFENCQRKFYLTRVAKACQQQDTVATNYGKQVHKAFEEYLRDGTPLEPRFAHFEPYVAPLKAFPGILCEYEMGLREDFSPCGFGDEDAWLRGIADFISINEEKGTARVGDFKTGKSSRYADVSQLELMAAMVMQHFPKVNHVKGALLFVVAGDIIKAEYSRKQLPEILSGWVGKTAAIGGCMESGVWNPRTSGLCKFCPATSGMCEFK